MSDDLSGKHVVITGGTGTLGTAVVESLLASGAICHVPCYGEQASCSFADHEHATLVQSVDLRSETAVVEYYESLPQLWGSIHIAGGFAMSPVADTSLADFEKMLALNAVTCFLCCREAVRSMRKGAEGGRIVNVAARPAVQPTAGMIAYSTSKAAVAALTTSLAAEVGDEQILVNAVLPSIIDSPANRSAMPKADHDSWPKPAQIASTIVFLLSPTNQLTTGALLPVYGRA